MLKTLEAHMAKEHSKQTTFEFFNKRPLKKNLQNAQQLILDELNKAIAKLEQEGVASNPPTYWPAMLNAARVLIERYGTLDDYNQDKVRWWADQLVLNSGYYLWNFVFNNSNDRVLEKRADEEFKKFLKLFE
jgi:hypothetical protein